jgi:hypothetical protein
MAKRYLEAEGVSSYRTGREWDYDDPVFRLEEEFTPLEETLGTQGVREIDTNDRSLMAWYDMELFSGGAEEGSLEEALEIIGTNILVAGACAADDDVGMVVSVEGNSDLKDFGSMIDDIIHAETISDLEEILNVYEDIPGAKELAKVCAQKLSEGRLALVS